MSQLGCVLRIGSPTLFHSMRIGSGGTVPAVIEKLLEFEFYASLQDHEEFTVHCPANHPSQSPSLPIRRIDIRVGLFIVRKPHMALIPQQRLSGEADGDGAEERHLG